jgi:leucine dehydrogenase
MSAVAKRRTAQHAADQLLDGFDYITYMEQHGHEQLAMFVDRETGLRVMIALHNTTLGPGVGGARMRHYTSSAEAMLDVLRLSEGMTYKAAVAGLPLGGAKAVILADGREEHDPELRAARFRAFGRFVESLSGRYITAEDVGTSPADMCQIRAATLHVAGLPREAGGCGDPSPTTAYGVLRGMQALAEDAFGRASLEGVRVAVQGLGHVGMSLVEQLLRDQGAVVVAADVRPAVVQEARECFAADRGFSLVPPEAIHLQDCEIFAPCALGAVLTPVTIPQLRCRIIAGAANNQLADEDRDGDLLRQRGIAYAADYVVNAGGLIHVMHDIQARGTWSDTDAAAVRSRAASIYNTVRLVLERARAEDISPHQAARAIARETIAVARGRA